jgi:Zn-finger nucleic acid-binding protein
VEGVGVSACAKCHGTRLTPPQLHRLLEAMSAELLKSFDPDTGIDRLNEASAHLPCPTCARPMVSGDYCGARLVFFDRCDRCGLLWVNADELGTMSLMWTRMDARQSRSHAQMQELLSGTDGLIRQQRIARVVSNILFRVLG